MNLKEHLLLRKLLEIFMISDVNYANAFSYDMHYSCKTKKKKKVSYQISE